MRPKVFLGRSVPSYLPTSVLVVQGSDTALAAGLQRPGRRGQVHVFGLRHARKLARVSRKMYQTPDFAILLHCPRAAPRNSTKRAKIPISPGGNPTHGRCSAAKKRTELGHTVAPGSPRVPWQQNRQPWRKYQQRRPPQKPFAIPLPGWPVGDR